MTVDTTTRSPRLELHGGMVRFAYAAGETQDKTRRLLDHVLLEVEPLGRDPQRKPKKPPAKVYALVLQGRAQVIGEGATGLKRLHDTITALRPLFQQKLAWQRDDITKRKKSKNPHELDWLAFRLALAELQVEETKRLEAAASRPRELCLQDGHHYRLRADVAFPYYALAKEDTFAATDSTGFLPFADADAPAQAHHHRRGTHELAIRQQGYMAVRRQVWHVDHVRGARRAYRRKVALELTTIGVLGEVDRVLALDAKDTAEATDARALGRDAIEQLKQGLKSGRPPERERLEAKARAALRPFLRKQQGVPSAWERGHTNLWYRHQGRFSPYFVAFHTFRELLETEAAEDVKYKVLLPRLAPKDDGSGVLSAKEVETLRAIQASGGFKVANQTGPARWAVPVSPPSTFDTTVKVGNEVVTWLHRGATMLVDTMSAYSAHLLSDLSRRLSGATGAGTLAADFQQALKAAFSGGKELPAQLSRKVRQEVRRAVSKLRKQPGFNRGGGASLRTAAAREVVRELRGATAAGGAEGLSKLLGRLQKLRGACGDTLPSLKQWHLDKAIERVVAECRGAWLRHDEVKARALSGAHVRFGFSVFVAIGGMVDLWQNRNAADGWLLARAHVNAIGLTVGAIGDAAAVAHTLEQAHAFTKAVAGHARLLSGAAAGITLLIAAYDVYRAAATDDTRAFVPAIVTLVGAGLALVGAGVSAEATVVGVPLGLVLNVVGLGLIGAGVLIGYLNPTSEGETYVRALLDRTKDLAAVTQPTRSDLRAKLKSGATYAGIPADAFIYLPRARARLVGTGQRWGDSLEFSLELFRPAGNTVKVWLEGFVPDLNAPLAGAPRELGTGAANYVSLPTVEVLDAGASVAREVKLWVQVTREHKYATTLKLGDPTADLKLKPSYFTTTADGEKDVESGEYEVRDGKAVTIGSFYAAVDLDWSKDPSQTAELQLKFDAQVREDDWGPDQYKTFTKTVSFAQLGSKQGKDLLTTQSFLLDDAAMHDLTAKGKDLEDKLDLFLSVKVDLQTPQGTSLKTYETSAGKLQLERRRDG